MTKQKAPNTARLLLAYMAFGFVHEAAHWTTALLLGGLDAAKIKCSIAESPVQVLVLLAQCLFGRQADMQDFMVEKPLYDQTSNSYIRHAGWIVSCLVAAAVHFACFAAPSAHRLRSSSWILVMAYAVALEALVTDLFQFVPTPTTAGILYCGNFGLILLNPMWLQAPEEQGNCHSALKILQDMIRVTMMRGAQAGGVVTFEPQPGGHMKAIRSRVVNRKRTDLSEGIIKKVKADNKKNFATSASTSTAPTAMTFAGHTRFATSSIADFGGTHPHQWSPRAMRNVYDMETATASLVGVENYIMHNGTLYVSLDLTS